VPSAFSASQAGCFVEHFFLRGMEQDAASAWLEPLSRSRAGASFVVASRGHGEMVREAMVMAMGRTVAPKVRTDVA
jgi:hypothetical protein